MIEVTELTKSYGDKRGVENITFSINKGEIVGLLGPNGAGKSTIMKMIAGYLFPDSGTIVVDGFDILDNPKEVSKRIGFLSEIPPLYMDMSVADYLNFICEIRGISSKQRKSHKEEIMELTKISHVSQRLIKNLSKGYRQRVGLAQALVGMPELLIFDEPTVGLDPKQITEVRNLIKELSKDHTVIVSSHILPEINMICEKIIIINEGHIVAQDTIKNLSNGIEGKNHFIVRVKGETEKVKKVITALNELTITKECTDIENYCSFELSTKKEETARIHLFEAMAENKLPIVEMKTINPSLEEAFLWFTKEQTEEKGVR